MKPQVLIFIDWYSPGYKAGGPVRSMVNMIAQMHEEIDFHVVTSDTEYTETVPYPNIAAGRWTKGACGESIYYTSASNRNKKHWKAILNHKKWDAIYVNGMYSLWFSVAPLWFSKGMDVKKVVASRGMLAPGAMQYGSIKKRLFLAGMKTFGAYKGVTWQATNEVEAGQIKSRLGATKVSIAPNLPKKLTHTNVPKRNKNRGELKIVSVARIAVEKNTHLAIESLRCLQGKVSFELYGPVYGGGYWEYCQEEINALPKDVQVISKGPIPPGEVPQILRNAHVLLMPSSGENFGHTMLEALCEGLPIIISNKTPWRGLNEAKAGADISVDDEAEAQLTFEKLLQGFVNMDQAEYDIWNAGAFAYAKNYLANNEALEQNRQLFR